MPNVKDIAKAAGVSPAAVSYVLNNRPGEVSADTRIRVMKAVRDLGYRPKPSLPQSRSVRTDTIGLVMMHRSVISVGDGGFFSLILDGVLKAAYDRQVATTIFTYDQWFNAKLSDLHASVRGRLDGRCDGMLLLTPPSENEIVPILHERGYPFVLVSGDSDIPGVASVDVDNRRSAGLAMKHLLDLGHRRIAHLPGQKIFFHARQRQDAYQDALAAAGIPFDPQLLLDGEYWAVSGAERAVELMKLPQGQRPTAIFCANDSIAAGAIPALQSIGVRVPDDVSVIGMDDTAEASAMVPPLTTIKLPQETVGYRATEVLLDLIAKKPTIDHTEVSGSELIVRKSTAPPPLV